MKVINQICDESQQRGVFNLFPDNFSEPNILSTICNTAPKFEDVVVSCKLFGTWTACDDYFSPIITEEGLCYTFNAMSLKEIATNE